MRCRVASSARFKSLKLAAFAAYGGAVCSCVNCPERENPRIEFLTIDHIAGGGNQHRKVVGSGSSFYAWLRNNKYPQGYQVLCMNCNWGRRLTGVCPHGGAVDEFSYTI